MKVQKNQTKNYTWLFIIIGILVFFCLFPLLWIPGIIWMIFFFKKVENKITRYISCAIVVLVSLVSLIFFGALFSKPNDNIENDTEQISTEYSTEDLTEIETETETETEIETETETETETEIETETETESEVPDHTDASTPATPEQNGNSSTPAAEGSDTNNDAAASAPDNASTDSNDAGGNGSNFNTYDNPEQQNTTASYVLNTSTRKIHLPNCRSVAKIAPQNYATSDKSIADLEAEGYSRCGNCLK